MTKTEGTRASLGVLVAANAVAVAGVLVWDWKVVDLVFLYWFENLVIGALNVPRMLIAQPDLGDADLTPAKMIAGKVAAAAFFVLHYGLFSLGHAEALAHLFFPATRTSGGASAAIGTVFREPGMVWAMIAIAAGHGFLFLANYVGRREYVGADIGALMIRPYKRVLVVTIFILLGGLVLKAFKLPVAALLVFIALKIAADAYFHRKDHVALGRQADADDRLQPRYIEYRDPQGRVTIEVTGKMTWILASYVLLVAGLGAGLLFDESLGIPRGVTVMVAILFVLGGLVHYSISRKQMHILIDPVSQKLAIGRGSRQRLVPLETVTAAVVEKQERKKGGETWIERRVELLLRGGGRLPIREQWTEFSDADCQKMAARINAALRG